MCDDYGDYDDEVYNDGYEASIANDAYAKGYEAARKDLADSLSAEAWCSSHNVILSEHLVFCCYLANVSLWQGFDC